MRGYCHAGVEASIGFCGGKVGIEGNVVILQAAVLSTGSHMVESHLCHTRVGFPVNFQQWGIFKES